MSVECMTAVFKHSRSKGAARLVLLAMADSAHESGELSAYPRSQSLLARKANIDGVTVRRALMSLISLGEIEVIKRGDGRTSSDYRITLPELTAIEGVQDARPARAARTPRGRAVHSQGVQDARPIIPSSPVDNPSVAHASDDAGKNAAKKRSTKSREPMLDALKAERQRYMPAAKGIVAAVYRDRSPKPTVKGGQVALVQRAVDLLAAGWMPDQVRRAMMRASSFTIDALTLQINGKSQLSSNGRGIDALNASLAALPDKEHA